jgi:hypothetical protein
MNWFEDPDDDEEPDTGPLGSHSDPGPGPYLKGCGILAALILATGATIIIYRLLSL